MVAFQGVKKPHEAREIGMLRFVARELGAYALHGALGAIRRKPRPSEDGAAVLFIHGHGGGGGAFALLERALRRRGHRRFVAWDYRSSGTVEEVAQRLARFAHASLGEDLHVIGHSLGGIIARLWLQELGGREQARSLTTLSTPHRGLAPVPGARALPLVREIVPGSPLLDRLDRGVDTLDGLPSLAVVSSRDHFVRPWHAAGFGKARLVPVSGAGHVGVLFSEEVARLVSDHLDEAGRAAGG